MKQLTVWEFFAASLDRINAIKLQTALSCSRQANK